MTRLEKLLAQRDKIAKDHLFHLNAVNVCVDNLKQIDARIKELTCQTPS